MHERDSFVSPRPRVLIRSFIAFGGVAKEQQSSSIRCSLWYNAIVVNQEIEMTYTIAQCNSDPEAMRNMLREKVAPDLFPAVNSWVMENFHGFCDEERNEWYATCEDAVEDCKLSITDFETPGAT